MSIMSVDHARRYKMASKESDDVQKVLEFRIYKCSSYQFTYVPENILVDKPTDQSSRWSSHNNNQNQVAFYNLLPRFKTLFEFIQNFNQQYVILKLLYPSIVKTITFGKYKSTHVCNIKRFKVYGGMESENMMELLESGLKNNSIPETFELKHTVGNDKTYFPVRYIKIVPLLSWGPNFDYSIWHIRLTGITDYKLIKSCIDWITTYRRKEVIRLCMKHFRRLEQSEIVETLKRITGVPLEDPQLSTLYDLLVLKGEHEQAEYFLSHAIKNGLMNDYINAQTYKAVWTKLPCGDVKPGMRGGHQMVLDSSAKILYLFGGWDGNQDLADLWSYNLAAEKWTLICKDTGIVGGPSARSCHKMCLDPKRRQLFTLGRYLDTQYRTPANLKSDFYVYDIETDEWTQISQDTAQVGGPQLIFDHQISMDVEKSTIYVFGGRVLLAPSSSEDSISASPAEPIFSGLYSYHVPTDTWNKISCDIARPSGLDCPTIRSRVGHSMLFHQGTRKLYIFAGQRGKEYINDFFAYNIDTKQIENILLTESGPKDTNPIPAAGFTQRATIDPELQEIYVFSGLSKDKEKRDDNVQNSFWVYNITNNRWTCIYRNENVGEKYWNKMQEYEPCPRFAHQLVYDHISKIHYLFGGNPGRSCHPNLRLDDFWQLKLCRPSHEQILKKCKLIIRKHKFEELAMDNSIEALEYLQTKVSEIIDHSDPIQIEEFQQLTSILFRGQTISLQSNIPNSSSIPILDNYGIVRNTHTIRTELYDKITEFFSESLTQPRANLIDLLSL